MKKILTVALGTLSALGLSALADFAFSNGMSSLSLTCDIIAVMLIIFVVLKVADIVN